MSTITKMTDDQPMVVVNFAASKITSSREISREDVDIDFARLPDTIKAFLRQEFISRASLSEFSRLEKQARKFLQLRSVQTDLGFLMSVKDAVECVSMLETTREEYLRYAESFLNRYDTLLDERAFELEERLDGWPEADAIVRAVRQIAPTVDEVRKRISFRFSAARIEPVETFDKDEEAMLQAGLISLRKGLYGKLVNQLARDAILLRDRIEDRERKSGDRRATQKTVDAGRDLRKKVQRLMFIDPRAEQLEGLIQDALDQIPSNGPISGADYTNFLRIVQSLADEKAVLEMVEQGEPLLEVRSNAGGDATPADSAEPEQHVPEESGEAVDTTDSSQEEDDSPGEADQVAPDDDEEPTGESAQPVYEPSTRSRRKFPQNDLAF